MTVKATSAVRGLMDVVSSCSCALMFTLKPHTALSGVLCSLPLLISKEKVTVSPSTLITSLGHPEPRTDLLPNPRVFPPYSLIFLEFVLGPATYYFFTQYYMLLIILSLTCM